MMFLCGCGSYWQWGICVCCALQLGADKSGWAHLWDAKQTPTSFWWEMPPAQGFPEAVAWPITGTESLQCCYQMTQRFGQPLNNSCSRWLNLLQLLLLEETVAYRKALLQAGCSWPCSEHQVNWRKGVKSCGMDKKGSTAGDPREGTDAAVQLLLFRVHPDKSLSWDGSEVFQ